jgi:adenylate cyclase
VKYLIEDTNKKKLNKALSEYVWVNIADEILLEHWKVNLDGQQKNLVCFFSDIEGFTNLSEDLSPGELVTFLREYLSEMTSIIMDKKWHIDKFEGDAIMALWWAFTEHSNTDYIEACNAALQQQKALGVFNKKWNKKFGKNIRARMGIHGGKAIIWNIGAIGRKMEFTALWDNVNLASRLEWVNKFYGTYICVSEVVYLATKDFFAFRYLDEIQVKWKDIPVKIYELLWNVKDVWENQRQIHNAFIWAIGLYKERNFTDAYDIFSRLWEEWDAPSKTYADRCLDYQKNPPTESWDWVYRMTEK